MRKLYDALLVPEWRRVISPANLADSILQVLRTVTSRIAALVKLDLTQETTRPYYRTLSVKLSDITYSSGVYSFPCNIKNADVFGCGLAAKMALRGRDFTYDSGVYSFNSDPSNFGTISVNQVGQIVLTLVALGGDLSTDQSPLELVYHATTAEPTRKAIHEAVYGDAPNGITRHLLEAVGDCRLSTEELEQVWTEGDYKLGITSGGQLVYAPVAAGIGFTSGAVINTGNTITTNHGCVYYNWPYINDDAHQQEALSNFILNLGNVSITVTATGYAGNRILLGNNATEPVVAASSLVLTGRKGKSFNFQ